METSVLKLPPPRSYRLADLPLVAAIAQVRFPLVARLQGLPGIAPFQDQIQASFPYMEMVQQQELAVVVGPFGAAPAGGSSAVAWKFTDDADWTLILESGAATLAVGKNYSDVATFVQRWTAVLKALREVVGITKCDRMGVRYIDLIPALSGSGWLEWLRPDLTGLLAGDLLSEAVHARVHLTQVQLVSSDLEEAANSSAPSQGVLRYGLLPTGTSIPILPMAPALQLEEDSFILDMDFSTGIAHRFEPAALIDVFTTFHQDIDAFFWWALTEEGRKHFGFVTG